MAIPFLGRLALYEYPLLVVSFTLAWLEYIISIITMFLPDSVIKLFTITTRQIYSLFNIAQGEKQYYYKGEDLTTEEHDVMTKLIYSDNIEQMAEIFGYTIDNHIVKTKDNYLLNIHRVSKPGPQRPSNGKIVYLHHGLLMCSEIWMTMLDKNLNLPLVLYDLGYDVWLGNNRGNKYCQKHIYHSVKLEQFWNFSLDEFAIFDIPNIIDYILTTSNINDKLTYIGFSQGTAQVFGSVSINNDLNEKIDQIIAISPATTPHGLYSKFLDIFVKASPNVIYLLFSRKVLMPSVLFWQRIMYPPLFNSSIDMSNYLLFNWKSLNILEVQKLCSYGHLYSTTSVKTVVHWFQIMKNKNFQMYFDRYNYSGYYQPMSYPLKNIKIPIHLIYGNQDSLVDINVMKNQLPTKSTTSVEVDGHEHLDNIWGSDIGDRVFKHVLHYLGEDKPNGSVQY